MPRQTAKTSNEAPYKNFADNLQEWTLKYRLRHPAEPYYQKDTAVIMGMSPAVFSRIVQGRERPSPEQSLAIARFFSVPVENVLRVAGYDDLAALRQWVEDDETPRKEREKQYILNVLAIALRASEWQLEPWHESPYKDRAERALASSGDPYMRALDYADAVYDWGHSDQQQRRTARQDRSTEDLPFLISGGGA